MHVDDVPLPHYVNFEFCHNLFFFGREKMCRRPPGPPPPPSLNDSVFRIGGALMHSGLAAQHIKAFCHP